MSNLLIIRAQNTIKDQPLEEFSFIINSGSDKSFIVPTGGYSGGVSNQYSWIIDWGDGEVTSHTGMGSDSIGITHIYPSSYKEYEIKIRPADPDNLVGWLNAFGFNTGYSGYGVSSNKVKLKRITSGELSLNTIDSSRSYFCNYMFYGCTGLTSLGNFNLSQGITSVDSGFCSGMFQNCTNVTIPDTFRIPTKISSGAVGEKFFYRTFSGVKTVINPIAILGDTCYDLISNAYYLTFEGCNLAAPLNPEVLPQLTKTSNQATFRGCTPAEYIVDVPVGWK